MIGAGTLPVGSIAHKVATSLYGAMLVFIDWNSMRRAHSASAGIEEPKPRRIISHFRLAFATAAANPATALFFASSMLNLNVHGTTKISAIAVPVVFIVAITWFGLVGLSISQPVSRRFYLRQGQWAAGMLAA